MVEEPLARRQEAHAARRTLEERRAELVFDVSGFLSPRCVRSLVAKRPNSSSRVFSCAFGKRA